MQSVHYPAGSVDQAKSIIPQSPNERVANARALLGPAGVPHSSPALFRRELAPLHRHADLVGRVRPAAELLVRSRNELCHKLILSEAFLGSVGACAAGVQHSLSHGSYRIGHIAVMLCAQVALAEIHCSGRWSRHALPFGRGEQRATSTRDAVCCSRRIQDTAESRPIGTVNAALLEPFALPLPERSVLVARGAVVNQESQRQDDRGWIVTSRLDVTTPSHSRSPQLDAPSGSMPRGMHGPEMAFVRSTPRPRMGDPAEPGAGQESRDAKT